MCVACCEVAKMNQRRFDWGGVGCWRGVARRMCVCLVVTVTQAIFCKSGGTHTHPHDTHPHSSDCVATRLPSVSDNFLAAASPSSQPPLNLNPVHPRPPKPQTPESSMASTIVGTPQYLSPEMCDNKPYGKKSDVWALGCILYELCSLRKAFDGGTGGISGIIIKIMRGVYEPVPTGYSDELRGLVGTMLQVKPRRRWVVFGGSGLLAAARSVPESSRPLWLQSMGGSRRD